MKPRLRVAIGVVALSLGCACGAAPAAAGKGAQYQRGDIVVITGIVTDAVSKPLADVEVVLKASRRSYDYLRFRKRTPVEREVVTTSSSEGLFELEWTWDGGFNRFELLFGVTVAKPGGETFQVLHTEDLSKRIGTGSPVVSNVRIEDTRFLESFREFQAGLHCEAQRQVYREAGKPDKVRARVSPDHTEVDWWYFSLGKVYRFRDGELTETESFEPVQPFDS